jgi:hypothetical protein
MVRRGAHSRHRRTRMTCEQGVSGVLGGVNLAKHSQTVSFVCATKKTNSFGECGSNNTPQHPPTPPLKMARNFKIPASRWAFQKKWIFLAPAPAALV